MDKRLIFIILLVTALALLAACGANGDMSPDEPDPIAFVRDGAPADVPPPAAAVGDDAPISRGMVAKMLALTFSDIDEIDRAPRRIAFADAHPALWHDRYINTAVALGHLNGGGGNFYPDDPLTLAQAQAVLDRLDPNNPIRIQLTEENRDLAISYALWVNLYMQLLENISGYDSIEARFGLVQENVIVLITPGFNPQLPQGHAVTNMGRLATAGISLEEYLNQEITILRRGREMLAILGLVSDTPTIPNAYIVSRNTDSITIFAGGATRTFYYDTTGLPEGSIADVRINGQTAEDVQVFGQTVAGVVQELTQHSISIEGMGILALHSAFGIYDSLGNGVTMGAPAQITIGYNTADFVLRDGQVAAAIIARRAAPEHIRVVISTTDFASRVHQSVALHGEGGLVVQYAGGAMEIAPNEVFELSAEQNLHLLDNATGRIIIEPLGDDGKITISSIRRSWPDGAAPQYRGILEVSRRANGFVIVNQLSLEQYLYAVIPSEMPAAFGATAAKVQAVTARSYAYNAIFANRFYMYGANVCDSIQSQVYANFPETATAQAAVQATEGRVLAHNGQVISANFFSTSAGHTTNSGDVWLNGQTWEFDRPTPIYLSARPQHDEGDFGDLSQEENIRAFVTNTEISSFDDHSPWFRWHVTLSRAELTEIINRNLPGLAAASPHLFQMPQPSAFPPQFVSNIGQFLYMSVVSRGGGGNVRELLIVGDTDSVLVRTEYAIRRLLAPSAAAGITLHRHNASPVTNHFMLPSTFMAFEETNGSLTIFGGGFGHGVGMSQNGVYGMAQRGYDYQAILAHFYPGTQIMQLTYYGRHAVSF